MDAVGPIATSHPPASPRVEIVVRPAPSREGAGLRAAEHFRRERDEAILRLAACERQVCASTNFGPETRPTPTATGPERRPYAADPVGTVTPRRSTEPGPPPVIPLRSVLQTTNVGTLLDVLA